MASQREIFSKHFYKKWKEPAMVYFKVSPNSQQMNIRKCFGQHSLISGRYPTVHSPGQEAYVLVLINTAC
jgi:hypothetical protein